MEELLQYLNSLSPLSIELYRHLSDVLKNKKYLKKDFLLKSGNVSDRIFFIENGLVRCFYDKHEKEVCSWFMKENDCIISVESFFQQKTSYENIQALEETNTYYIEYKELQFIYLNFSEFNFIGRVLTEKYYALSEQRLYSLRMQNASERYHFLMEKYPELIQRVPSKYLASYLGVSEETLSRNKR
jgi:CRP/FNR family transcriptional regulator, anaerobic regulatory protein